MVLVRADVDAVCAALPGARLGKPPKELPAWKVGERMFAFLGDFGEDDAVTVRCADAETAETLIAAGEAQAPGHLPRSWVRLPFDRTPRAAMRHRVHRSYDIVRAGLTRTVRAALAPREDS